MSNNTSNKIAVSVIIPITTTETYLARCLDSVLTQTLHNIEVILVDISSDVPSSLCAKYAVQDSRIKILNKRGVGYGAAFNAGLAEATGEYIAFVDSCDWLEPEMYEVLYEIASDQNVDVVHCLSYIDKDSNKQRISNPFANINLKERQRYVNERSDYKFYVPILLFYSEDLYKTIYKKSLLTDNQIKFSDKPGSNSQNLGFTFLVFCHMVSFYIHEAPLYHLNPKRSYFTDKSFTTALQSVDEYYYIKKLIEERGLEDKYIGKRYLHIAMVKIFRHIRHRYLVHCQNISQKLEFLRSVEPLLKDYYPLKNDNMFMNGREKRVYKRLLRHPIKASIKYTASKTIKRLGKRLLTDITFHSKNKQIRIFGFRFFFYKKTANYFTFNLCHLPIIRRRKHSNIEENSVITDYYFLGLHCAQDVEINDWRNSTWFTNRKKYNQINNYLSSAYQLSLDKSVSRRHTEVFPQFKDTNKGAAIKIFGKGFIFPDSVSSHEGKIIACNKNIEIFTNEPNYFFASEHIASNNYYDQLTTANDAIVFFDCANAVNGMLAKRSLQIDQIKNYAFYYGNWRFYDAIRPDIENSLVAFFGDTVHSALHFALYTNPDVIYLIGCDVYEAGIIKNNRLYAATAEELIIGYKRIKSFKDSHYPNTKIICVNPNGLEGIFEEEYTNDFMKLRQEGNSEKNIS